MLPKGISKELLTQILKIFGEDPSVDAANKLQQVIEVLKADIPC